jgi:NAD(P)-dependent dehydrogenase (short-subunit alcohol dehydrogenase family)
VSASWRRRSRRSAATSPPSEQTCRSWRIFDRLFAQIEREKGRLDIVFANAGIWKYAPLGTITEEHYDSIFDVNVKGLLLTVQKALPLLPYGASIILAEDRSLAWERAGQRQ